MNKAVTTDRREFLRATLRWSAAVALGALAGLVLHRRKSGDARCILPCTACPLAKTCTADFGAVKSKNRKESMDEPRPTTTFPQ